MTVSRDGEPQLTRGPLPGSVKRPNEYRILTTPVPAGPHGYDWVQFFNSKLNQSPFSGNHDGNAITVECWPDDKAEMIEKVDAAIVFWGSPSTGDCDPS